MKDSNNRPSTLLSVPRSEVFANGRIKYYPTHSGEWEVGVIDLFEERGAFRKKGFEECGGPRKAKPSKVSEPKRERMIHDESLDEVTFNPHTGQNVTKWGYCEGERPNSTEVVFGCVKYDATENAYHMGTLIVEYFDAAKQAAIEKKNADKGRRRAIARLFDYVRCNWDLDCMFTLTFDKERIDRESYEGIVKKVGEWFANRVRRQGLKYIAVPEYHADGKAIHFHGVCNFAALQTKYSGVVQNGKGVYNITDFPFGFTAVKKIGSEATDRHAVAVYVSKYITKSTEKVGGRYYLHGGKMVKPREVVCEITPEDIEVLTKNFSCSRWECPTPIGGRYVKYTVQHFKAEEV